MSFRAFIVADAHGNWGAIEGLLKQEQLPNDKVFLVHLGDLANCVSESYTEDMECLQRAREVFDILLVGNHEHPYWPGYTTRFRGFQYYPDIAHEILDLSNYDVAFEFGNVLVTHAGLVRGTEGRWPDAFDAAADLNIRFAQNPCGVFFNAIGFARGGNTPTGGILWSDWDEGKLRTFSQVVGHTPGDKIRTREHSSTGTQVTCIDLGAKKPGRPIAGAWIDADGTITPVIYDPKASDASSQ